MAVRLFGGMQINKGIAMWWFDKILGGCVIGLVLFYKRCVSPFLPHMCRFEPPCSVYMVEAIRKYGVIRGVWKGVKRICRCNPWGSGGYDPP